MPVLFVALLSPELSPLLEPLMLLAGAAVDKVLAVVLLV